MKYWILTFSILFVAALTMCACSNSDDDPKQSEEPTTTKPTVQAGKVLVAYFSCTGTTKGVAEDIAEIAGGTLYRIEPETPYTSADLDYNSDCRANREQNNPAARPEIKGTVENIDAYDVVFLGYPIWWGQAPKIIYTFLEANDFAGKCIIPFCTSHSSGIGSSDTNLHPLATGANWKGGKRFGQSHSKSEIEAWIKDSDISFTNDSTTEFDLAAGVNGNAPTIKQSSGYGTANQWRR